MSKLGKNFSFILLCGSLLSPVIAEHYAEEQVLAEELYTKDLSLQDREALGKVVSDTTGVGIGQVFPKDFDEDLGKEIAIEIGEKVAEALDSIDPEVVKDKKELMRILVEATDKVMAEYVEDGDVSEEDAKKLSAGVALSMVKLFEKVEEKLDAKVSKEVVYDDDMTDPEVIETEPEPFTGSLMDARPEVFHLGLFSINTVDDPQRTHVKAFDRSPVGILVTYGLGKNWRYPERGQWDNVDVQRRTKFVYGANLKFEMKFEGYRKPVGAIVERLLGLTRKYKGVFGLDEYKNFPLWNVALYDVEDLRGFLTYIEGILEARGMKSFDGKPVLRLHLASDPMLETLELEDWARLRVLFDVVDLRDTKTLTFFGKTQFQMEDLNRELCTSRPASPGRPFRVQLLEAVERPFKNFDYVELGPAVVIGVVTGIVALFGNEVYKAIIPKSQWITNGQIRGGWIPPQKKD